MILWLKDCPKYNIDNNHKCTSFIDSLITCSKTLNKNDDNNLDDDNNQEIFTVTKKVNFVLKKKKT